MTWLGANSDVQRAWSPMCCTNIEKRVGVSTTELFSRRGVVRARPRLQLAPSADSQFAEVQALRLRGGTGERILSQWPGQPEPVTPTVPPATTASPAWRANAGCSLFRAM